MSDRIKPDAAIAAGQETIRAEARALDLLADALAGPLREPFVEAAKLLAGTKGRVIVSGMGLMIMAFGMLTSSIQEMHRVVMPGKAEIMLPGGRSTLYAERRSIVGGKAYHVEGLRFIGLAGRLIDCAHAFYAASCLVTVERCDFTGVASSWGMV